LTANGRKLVDTAIDYEQTKTMTTSFIPSLVLADSTTLLVAPDSLGLFTQFVKKKSIPGFYEIVL